MRVGGRRVANPQAAKAEIKTFPAPKMGQVANENVAEASIGGAAILDNWRPTTRGIALRGGSTRHATVSGAVKHLFTYDGGVRKMFACTATSIYDVTSPASATEVPEAAVSDQTSGDYSTAMMNTTGGDYAVIVNGSDPMLLYDGTEFKAITDLSDPAIADIDTSRFSHVWVYRNRLWFVEKSTLNAWYLDVDSIAGDAEVFPLAGVFPNGGALLFGARWSLDAGDGLDDKCVFVSTNGEVAVYEGSDPGGENDWRLVGVYQIGRPLGKNATMQAGGDLLIATVEGLVPISQAVNKDRAALSLASPSFRIAPEWAKDVTSRPDGWGLVKWPAKKIAVVCIPAPAGYEQYCRVLHLETGAWGRYTGWDTQCGVEFQDLMFFGTSGGRILNAEVGGTDDGAPYVCTAVLSFDHFGTPGPIKTVQMARASFLASVKFNPQVSASANYTVDLPSAPNGVTDDNNADLWDIGLWDQARWDSDIQRNLSSRWASIGVTGYAIAMQIQVTCSGNRTPDAELVSIDTTYMTGALVV